MNAVEIEEAVSKLAEQPFDTGEFPFAFLEAFGNKATTIKRLRSGSSNSSDIAGGVLQRNNIHIAVCHAGEVSKALAALKASPATAKAKAKFILATDGVDLEAEDLTSGETAACAYPDFPNHFGFFLPLAGITTVRQIRNNPIDIQATGRLNRLYVELLKENPDWGTADRRNDMNQFMARLIFCFFAEDTDIFSRPNLFTETVEQMSDRLSENTHEVIAELFRAMDTRHEDREGTGLPRWADAFPWVNGGLFDGAKAVPRFSRIARSYLLHAGGLDWQLINPDIFGSMIQAVAEDEERGELGLHYTSVPNILKVLNPLFLDDLRKRLDKAVDNPRKLLNLRKRIARIRVFDPACGSGNFLVIAYIHMREIEAKILERRGESDRRSWIGLENFYGIEIKDFACEVARLSLLIAEFQCDVRLIGQKEAKELVLPLKRTGKIHCGNALRMDWLKVCPPVQPMVEEHDLAGPTGKFALCDSDEPEVETYICGNPPYKGGTEQTTLQKDDMQRVFGATVPTWRSFDYILAFFQKARLYLDLCEAQAAFVTTNSICQGEQVYRFWPQCISRGVRVAFAVTSFKWSNLASKNAGVSVCVVGLARNPRTIRYFEGVEELVRQVENINAYLVPYKDIYVKTETKPLNGMVPVINGSKPADGGGLIFGAEIAKRLKTAAPSFVHTVRPFFGAHDATHGNYRYCIWTSGEEYLALNKIEEFRKRFSIVTEMRGKSEKALTRAGKNKPYEFQQIRQTGLETVLQVPRHSSEARDYYPVIALPKGAIVGDGAFSFYDPPLWNMAIFVSRLSLVWIRTVCGKIKTDFRFSNTLGWNTFPVPKLTELNKAELTRCAGDILLAREAHFPATIADLYDPEGMPADLRAAHERNDEVLERIYIGRRFRNDTERLEKLFEMYTKMTEAEKKKPAKAARRGRRGD